MSPISLRSVRPLMFRTIAVSDLRLVNLADTDLKRLSASIEAQLKYEVEELLQGGGQAD